MWPLIRQNFQHIIRSKLLLLLIFVSFLIQWFGLRLFHSMTFTFNGIETLIGGNHILFIALFFQLFTGAFLSAIYGIWMIPYPHQGLRSQLNFVLPVSKWFYPLVYALNLACLLLLQFLVMLLSFATVFGTHGLVQALALWPGLGMCFILEVVAFEAITFAFAVSSMVLGQIPTFFLGAASFFVLQLGGAFFRLKFIPMLKVQFKSIDWFHQLYQFLPPIGELVFDLRRVFFNPTWEQRSLLLWGIWFVFFVLAFRFTIRYPAKLRSTEG